MSAENARARTRPTLAVPRRRRTKPPKAAAGGAAAAASDVGRSRAGRQPRGASRPRSPRRAETALGRRPAAARRGAGAVEFSDAVAIQLPVDAPDGDPQAVLHLRRPAERRSTSGSSTSPSGAAAQYVGKGSDELDARRAARRHRDRALRQGRVVGRLQARAAQPPAASRFTRRVRAHRVLGLGRRQPRARQQARPHHVVVPLRRARETPSPVGPDGRRLGARGLRLSSSLRRSAACRRRKPQRRLGGIRCIRTIYVPVDNSDYSNRAVDAALELGKAFELEADRLPRLRGEHARLPLQADGVHAARGVPRRDRARAAAQDPRQPDHDGPEADLGELPRRGCRSAAPRTASSSSRA